MKTHDKTGEQLDLFPDTLETTALRQVRQFLAQALQARLEHDELEHDEHDELEQAASRPRHIVALCLDPRPDGLAVQVQTLTADELELRDILEKVNETIGLYELVTRLHDRRRRPH